MVAGEKILWQKRSTRYCFGDLIPLVTGEKDWVKPRFGGGDQGCEG